MRVRPAKTQISLGIRPVWSVFAVHMKKAWLLSYPLSAQRRLIRLSGCPGWSESSLGTHSVCWFCHVVAHLVCQYLSNSHPYLYPFTFQYNDWQKRTFDKPKKLVIIHLITAKTITLLEPKSFGEVGGGHPLHIGHTLWILKRKTKKLSHKKNVWNSKKKKINLSYLTGFPNVS